MKIGVINIAYNTYETLPKAFEVWHGIKNISNYQVSDLYLTSVVCCFPETSELGYPIHSEDDTLNYLEHLYLLDRLYAPDHAVSEIDAWNYWLPWLINDKKIDLLWMVNSDEVWTVKQISQTLDFIQTQKLINYYKIQFKNYVFDDKTYTLDFITPRIWWVNRNSGLKGFWRDDLVEYNNGERDHQVSHIMIPRSIAFPEHFSWCGSPAKLKRKCEFGIKRYGLCSYLWNGQDQKLEFNYEYYKKMNKPVPELYHD